MQRKSHRSDGKCAFELDEIFMTTAAGARVSSAGAQCNQHCWRSQGSCVALGPESVVRHTHGAMESWDLHAWCTVAGATVCCAVPEATRHRFSKTLLVISGRLVASWIVVTIPGQHFIKIRDSGCQTYELFGVPVKISTTRKGDKTRCTAG